MNKKNIIIILGVIVIILLVAVGYLLMTQNTVANINANNTTISNSTPETQKTSSNSNVTPSNSNVNISAAKAKFIASEYLKSQPQFQNPGANMLDAGTPSLKGGIYYVPMVVTNNEGQASKSTVVGYVKVDAKTGQILGIQEISME